jgi:hypothetical protein
MAARQWQSTKICGGLLPITVPTLRNPHLQAKLNPEGVFTVYLNVTANGWVALVPCLNQKVCAPQAGLQFPVMVLDSFSLTMTRFRIVCLMYRFRISSKLQGVTTFLVIFVDLSIRRPV